MSEEGSPDIVILKAMYRRDNIDRVVRTLREEHPEMDSKSAGRAAEDILRREWAEIVKNVLADVE